MSEYSPLLLKQICEGALMAAGTPLSIDRLLTLFEEDQQPEKHLLISALSELRHDCLTRGIELVEVATGYRLQVRSEISHYVSRLWEEKPQRYSRALLETLALIAYRQPITRGDIEDVRGVVVSSNMIKTLLEREWVRVVGYRDVPGRPAMYATTAEFLDYFGLKSLEELPSLMEIKELDDANRKLDLDGDRSSKTPPDGDYQFVTDDEIAQRGAEVLSATGDDLEEANRLISQVEDNVYEEDSETGGRKVRDLGQILERLAQSSQTEGNPEADTSPDDTSSVDTRSADTTSADTRSADARIVTEVTSNNEPVETSSSSTDDAVNDSSSTSSKEDDNDAVQSDTVAQETNLKRSSADETNTSPDESNDSPAAQPPSTLFADKD